MHPVVEEIEHPLDHHLSAPRVAGGEHVGTEQQHRPHHVLGKRLTNAAGVRAEQVQLQPTDLV